MRGGVPVTERLWVEDYESKYPDVFESYYDGFSDESRRATLARAPTALVDAVEAAEDRVSAIVRGIETRLRAGGLVDDDLDASRHSRTSRSPSRWPTLRGHVSWFASPVLGCAVDDVAQRGVTLRDPERCPERSVTRLLQVPTTSRISSTGPTLGHSPSYAAACPLCSRPRSTRELHTRSGAVRSVPLMTLTWTA